MTLGAATDVEQPRDFAFTSDNLALAQRIIAKYPPGRQASAVLPLLDLAQRQHDNWLPRAAMDAVAQLLDMPRIRVYEVATFYSMFNRAPSGRHRVQVCTTTPCWLRGSDAIVAACERTLGIRMGETTADGEFTLSEVECLGACVNAPVVQIGDDYYEDLDAARLEALLDAIGRGEAPLAGSQIGRRGSCAVTGPTTLQALPFDPLAQETEPQTVQAEPSADTAIPLVPAAAPVAAVVAPGSGAPAGTEAAEKVGAEPTKAEAKPAARKPRSKMAQADAPVAEVGVETAAAKPKKTGTGKARAKSKPAQES